VFLGGSHGAAAAGSAVAVLRDVVVVAASSAAPSDSEPEHAPPVNATRTRPASADNAR